MFLTQTDNPKSFATCGLAASMQASLELAPGKHTLTLQFANAKHESYGKVFSKQIVVNVTK